MGHVDHVVSFSNHLKHPTYHLSRGWVMKIWLDKKMSTKCTWTSKSSFQIIRYLSTDLCTYHARGSKNHEIHAVIPEIVPNKILARVIGCLIVGWQVLPDQVIWSHCLPTSPNKRILYGGNLRKGWVNQKKMGVYTERKAVATLYLFKFMP